MGTQLTPELVHELADSLLRQGVQPTPENMVQRFNLEPADTLLEQTLNAWWQSLRGRMVLSPAGAGSPPDALSRAMQILWQDAVREASSQLKSERVHLETALSVLSQASESVPGPSQLDYETLQDGYKRQQVINDENISQIKVLEAEISTLKNVLASEVSQRKQAEEKLLDARNDLKRELKLQDDARRTFDNRLRDEQYRGQELVAKAEAETAQYRQHLDKLRDETGKKEAALTKNLHDLRSELAKKEVKIETLKGQIKGLEVELKVMRSDTGSQSRQITQLNTKLLSATNQAKRLEERVKELEGQLRQEHQRLSQCNADALRKESELRNALKEREDEAVRALAKVSGLQKKNASQEEQIRRLTAQLRG
ncbi:DNA-binding protein [Motiliproteus sp. SC1-56]|uniref:DNA-binding protein n=1 Tax=Motiliproteus sp. SC1-56 TaxID=2799565 RepID=UPI001A8CBF70|nr:DNA-binding protein [Motiliproteus sp. SC1-56]